MTTNTNINMAPNGNDYNPSDVEKKWQQKWEEAKLFTFDTNSKKNPFYVLEMLPYPSGRLHMGHVRNYTAGDAVARFRKMQGYNVLHTTGWDAFGLPAENAAIASQKNPRDWTIENIAQMKAQLKGLGFSYEWDREVSTCEPEYYKHEQAMFIDFFNAGIAYQKESLVNWDPVDQTVLANEQVINGKGWRSGATIVKRQLQQWFLKISDFSQDLLDGLDTLKDWPEQVKTMQSNWIGKSCGAEFSFKISSEEIAPFAQETLNKMEEQKIEVFSTRPETLFGCSFVAISPNHSIAQNLANNNSAIAEFIQECNEKQTDKNDDSKHGIFAGFYVEHPFNSVELKIDQQNIHTSSINKIPVYIANFVLSDYGSGALFGCPAHDQRDEEFAIKYLLPISEVIDSTSELMKNSFFLNGLNEKDARQLAINVLEQLKIGQSRTNFKLHDWGISRQRYWGCPIPMIHCTKCGIVPEKKGNLPITLPHDVEITGNGNPLESHPTWKHCTCPKCNGPAIRETDTFDTFFESSWYFIRYISPHMIDQPFDSSMANKLLPVHEYIGGIEHAILHLMYARFFVKALKKIGMLAIDEPFARLTTQGMVCHRAYQTQKGEWINPKEVAEKDGQPIRISNSEKLIDKGICKMSKSAKNVIDTDEMVNLYGADAIRLFILSNTPLDKNIEWSNKSAQHCLQYIKRVWLTIVNHSNIVKAHKAQLSDVAKIHTDLKTNTHESTTNLSAEATTLWRTTNAIVQDCTTHMHNFEFNKVIALLYTLCNAIDKIKTPHNNKDQIVLSYSIVSLIKLISPIAPHLADEAWQACFDDGFVIEQSWPSFDESVMQESTVSVGVQINGKLRDVISLPRNANQNDHQKAALSNQKIQALLKNQEIMKIIAIPGKIVSITTKK